MNEHEVQRGIQIRRDTYGKYVAYSKMYSRNMLLSTAVGLHRAYSRTVACKQEVASGDSDPHYRRALVVVVVIM
jgi:hypothetical protein